MTRAAAPKPGGEKQLTLVLSYPNLGIALLLGVICLLLAFLLGFQLGHSQGTPAGIPGATPLPVRQVEQLAPHVTAPNRNPAPAQPPRQVPAARRAPGWYVQLLTLPGTPASQAQIESLIAELRPAGYTNLGLARSENQLVLFAGPYADRQAAEAARARLVEAALPSGRKPFARTSPFVNEVR